ncbi:HepT-like ribonuclease domain-containing protein [Paenibacillus sp. M1]|uniref:HepT-like ribonuclease domain-containing protein n=1 Tax=Paenibacillus haidiansis TaxID=1574488 RepID=A0ABU7VQV7_9BACL
MYYVNREQIERRLNILPELTQVLQAAVSAEEPSLVERFAEERALHLAIEIVTDVGSYLIDGFIMRDASSYEDIVDIILDEKVIEADLHAVLRTLVGLRKPLVQEYFDWDRSGEHEMAKSLPQALERFARGVRAYLDKEGIRS